MRAAATAALLVLVAACAPETVPPDMPPVVVPVDSPTPDEVVDVAPDPGDDGDEVPPADDAGDVDGADGAGDDGTDGEAAPAPAPPDDDGWRAVWVHLFDDTLKSREGIAALVDQAAAADANVIIAQVARRHDAYYASSHLPATADPSLTPGLDVLAELVPRAHAAGIEVHAWVGMAPTWHAVYEDLPAPAGWLPADHGQRAPEAQRWVSRGHDGAWSEYLDPALPQVRDHLVAIVSELVASYPIDGIHLDYVRYASNRQGYHPDALAAYRAETGRSGTPAPTDAAWSAWRRDRTEQVIREVREAIPSATLSAAVISWEQGPSASGGFAGTRAYTDALQDWDGWVRAGLVDVVLPMNYFRSHVADQAAWFDQWLAYERDLAAAVPDVRVVPGVAGYLNAPTGGRSQIQAATAATGNAAMYSYQQPTDDASIGIWRSLAEIHWGAP